jgi:plastocyanin
MTTPVRMIAALTAVAAVSAAAALPTLAPAASKKHHTTGKTRKVGIFSDYYDPPKLTLHVGDKIEWTWHPSGLALHNVTVDSGPDTFESPDQASGVWARRFKKTGTWHLSCTEHPGMTMVVTVKKVPKK